MKKLFVVPIFLILTVISSILTVVPVSSQVNPQSESARRAKRLSTPRQTIENFLEFQNQPGINLDIASEGLRSDVSLSGEQRRMLARQLKQVLDGRALYVELGAIPDEPDYVDPTGAALYRPFPNRLPQFYVTKVGADWLFARETVDAIPALYAQTFSLTTAWLIQLLPEAFHRSFLGLALWQYVGLFLLLLVGLVLRKISDFFLDRALTRVVRTTPWLQKKAKRSLTFVKPAGFLVMVGFFYFTHSNLQLPISVSLGVSVLLELLIAVGVIWFVFGLIDLLSDYLVRATAKTESKLDDQLVPLLRKAMKVFVFIMAAVTIVQNYGYSVTSFLAGLGVGGIALALAAKDTLANFFGSITIFADKPFQVGDWVVIGEVEGTVEEVGFRSTRIRTFYNSLVTVPNSKLTDTSIDNMGLRHYRRIKEVLGLTYSTTSDQMHAFVEGIRAIIVANKYMRKDFYEIHFNGYGDYSLNVLVYCFLRVDNWSEELREKHNFFLEILRLAERVGVEFAFPTQTVHVDSVHQQRPRTVGKSLSDSEMAEVVEEFGPGGKLSRPHGPVMSRGGRKIDFSASAAAKTGDGE